MVKSEKKRSGRRRQCRTGQEVGAGSLEVIDEKKHVIGGVSKQSIRQYVTNSNFYLTKNHETLSRHLHYLF